VSRPRLVIATRNPGKLTEFRRLLGGIAWDVVGLDETHFEGELEEPGQTYEENATAKAVAVAEVLGETALADDSGIEVEALDGWPGPASARWLGEGRSDADRLSALLDEVERRCPGDRRARYVAVVALARPGQEPTLARGETVGALVTPQGTDGFGYDPSFLSDDLGVTFGTAAAADKDRVSHRGRALAALVAGGALRTVEARR
jgi:XTP/dITP diphosphohydrolase